MRLPRPATEARKSPMPTAPRSLVGVAEFPDLVRAAQRLNLTLREVDDRLSVEDVLDEADLAAYLYDVDHEPRSDQVTPTRR